MNTRRLGMTRPKALAVAMSMAVVAACGGPSNDDESGTSRSNGGDTVAAATTAPDHETNEELDVTEPTARSTDAPARADEPVPEDSTAPSTPATTDVNEDISDEIISNETASEMPPETDDLASAPCRRIADFDGGTSDAGWVIVNDGVMGGRSNGAVDISDSVMRFTGGVVTAGGGFTSVRYRLIGGEMADSTSLRLRVRADQRVYGVTLEDNAEVAQRSVSHRADFDTSGPVDAEGWTEVTLDYSELTPSVFGRSVEAPPFDPNSAREIGIIIADGVDGEFTLDVDWIDVCFSTER